MVESERLSRELAWWSNYSAAGSSTVERMMEIHEEVQRFVSRSSTAWEAELRRKVDGWKKAGEALRDELGIEVNQKTMHVAEMELTRLGTDGRTGRVKKGVLLDWLDNPVRKIERLAEGPGKEFFSGFLKEFTNATLNVSYERTAAQGRVQELMMDIIGTKSVRGLNKWLADWDKKTDLKLVLREIGVKKTKLTIEQTAELLAKRDDFALDP